MPGLEQAFESIGAAAEHHLGAAHAAGIVVGVTDREDLLGVVCRGMAEVASRTPVRPETRMQIGSISKAFASLLLVQEAAAGRVDLHVSVNEIVPWVGLPEPFGPITLHHLMTHTAGLLVGTEDAPTGPGALWRLRSFPATTAPGERFLYSNDGWKLVGACLEEVTGRPVRELLVERIFEPLGMASSAGAIVDREWTDLAVGYEPLFADRPVQLRHPLVPAPRIVSDTADGSIVSTIADMAAYARMVLARGDVPDGRGGRLVDDDVFREWTMGRVDDGDGGRYGYGWWTEDVDGRTWVAHSGGMVGYTALLVTVPDEGLAFVAMQNGDGSKRRLARTAIEAVSASLAGGEIPAPWIPPAPTDVPGAAAFAGRYEGDDGRVLEVAAEDGGLRVTIGPVSVLAERDPLTEPGDAFLLPHEALERYPLEFVRDADGTVVEAFHGATWFRGERVADETPPPPAEYARYVGIYRNDDPWASTLRILPRKGGLSLQWPVAASDEESSGQLVPLEDGWFAVGSVRSPRRVRFLGEGAGGLAVVAEFNGGSWFRSFEA